MMVLLHFLPKKLGRCTTGSGRIATLPIGHDLKRRSANADLQMAEIWLKVWHKMKKAAHRAAILSPRLATAALI
jgi:hypothetical protein